MKNFFFIPFFLLLCSCGRSPETLHRKGVQALNAGKNEKAAQWLAKAAEGTESSDAAEMWSLAGLAAARAEKGGDAEEYLKNSLELNPANEIANYNLGDLYLQQDRLEDATPYLKKSALSGNTYALEALAGVALLEGRIEEAYDTLQQAISQGENARLLTGLAVAGNGKLTVEETRRYLQQAETLDPLYAPAQLNLAALLDQNRLDPEQAATRYEAYLRLRPDDEQAPLIQLRLEIVKQRAANGDVSRPDPVRAQVEKLLEQASRAAESGNTSGALRLCLQANMAATREQRSDLRERALRAASTLAPDSARAHYGLGKFLLTQNRKREAMSSYETSRSLAPGLPMTLRPAVHLATDLGKSETADRMMESAEKAGSENPEFLLEIGDLYAEALNNERESRRIYRELIEEFPNDPVAVTARQRLQGS